MKHDGLTGRKGRKKVTSRVEFHLLCTLFRVGHQKVTELQESLTWTVGELIESALLLPERPRMVQVAVVDGVKEAFADHLASEATAVFLEQIGFPCADQLRLLEVMFCPNSAAHRAIRQMEKEITADLATRIHRGGDSGSTDGAAGAPSARRCIVRHVGEAWEVVGARGDASSLTLAPRCRGRSAPS